jgi:heme A synthase
LLLCIVPARIGWRFPAEEYPPGLRWWVPVNFTSVGLVIVLQIVNLAGPHELWPFLLGLVAILALSLFYFAYILFAPSRAEVRP